MPDARSHGGGVLQARRVLTMVPGLDGDSLWWQDGRIWGVGSAGIHAALEGKGFNGAPANGWRPEEKIGFSDAVSGYMVGAAHAAGAVYRRGALAPGFDADLVAWAVDPAAERGDGEAFRQGHAVLMIVGGETVMRV